MEEAFFMEDVFTIGFLSEPVHRHEGLLFEQLLQEVVQLFVQPLQ